MIRWFLGSRQERQRILAIAVPAILANSSAPLVGLVDTWAIGHLPGAQHLAAVGLGSVIFSYLLWAFGFLRMGTTGLVAQAHGKNDRLEMCRVTVRSTALAVALGLLMWLFQAPILSWSLALMPPPESVVGLTREYFDIRIWAAPATLFVYTITGVLFGTGQSRGVLVLQLVLNISNAALNLLFVIGFDMGVAGVALGTLLAQWLAAAFGVWQLYRMGWLRELLAASLDTGTWVLAQVRSLVMINGFIFIRTILLMTALALIMREAAGLGEAEMAASHVVNQYLLLISLGLDGFAHAAEALAGAAWGEGKRAAFRRWVRLTGAWSFLASMAYSALFALAGNDITALLTDLAEIRLMVSHLMPALVALPLVAVWSYHFDGVYIGATAATAMMVTMGVAFTGYLLVLGPMTAHWGLQGLWGAVLVFMALRGIAQALWYPYLARQLVDG